MKSGTSKTEIRVNRTLLWAFFLIFGFTALSAAEFRDVPLSPERREELDFHIRRLASPSTKIREQAKQKILTFGSAAIEPLQKAQNHPDLTVAESAIYCLRILNQDLVRADDPPEIKRNLIFYSVNEWYYRSLALSRLSYLDPDASLRPLLRILLHEKNSLACRSAALAVYWTLPHVQPFRQWPTVLPNEEVFPTKEFQMNRNKQAAEDRARLRDEIRRYLATETVQTPGKTLLLQLLDLESALQNSDSSEDSSENNTGNDASNVSAATFEIENFLEPILKEAVKEGKPEKMTFLQETLYVCADLLVQCGRRGEAEKFFRTWSQKNVCALELNHFQSNERRLQTLHIRFLLTQKLLARGNWDWGKSEMKLFLDQMQQTERIRYSRYFCNALRTLGDFAAAEEEMKELRRFQFLSFASSPETPLGQKNEKPEKDQSEEGTSEYSAQILYLQGLDACSKKNYSKAKKFLSQNMDLNENNNIDGFILARKLAVFTKDTDWLKEVDSKIDQQLEKTKKSIQILKKNPLIPQEELLMELNLFAWLAANTERELAEAQKFAQEAADLSPDSESIRDTLATTYAALGNFEKALEIQYEAVKINPHELELIQNLERIRFRCSEKK